ncbi:hypothetical protein BDN67DRAFT_1018111 [Paxillus ammoniavirescens]|nr:hypothetical protein BDN67DRAFT_1018111 [Paxillus ammoniavirescens]
MVSSAMAFSLDLTKVANGSYEVVWSTTTGERLTGLEHTHWVRNEAGSDELAGSDDPDGELAQKVEDRDAEDGARIAMLTTVHVTAASPAAVTAHRPSPLQSR